MTEFRAPCGCKIWLDPAKDTPRQTLIFCSLHDAAGDLLGMLKRALESLEEEDWCEETTKLIIEIQAAIAKAEGK